MTPESTSSRTPGSPTPGHPGCTEFAGLSRRAVLGGLLAGGALTVFGNTTVQTASAAGPAAMERAARAGRSNVVVVLSMRGAVDGMSLVVPHGDPVYYSARPQIAVPKSALVAGGAFFGLHPHLSPLVPLWNAGRMAAVHGTGQRVANRSHFSAMEEVEDADPTSSARVGWLNRLVGRDTNTSPLQGVHIGSSVPPASLIGPQGALAFESADKVHLAGHDKWDTHHRRPASVRSLWGTTSGPMGNAARTALRAIDEFRPVQSTAAAPRNGAVYPSGDLSKALASVARTLRGDVGVEVVTVDHGDWDHHTGLGTLGWGAMQQMATEFGKALAAFFKDLGTLAEVVTVVTISEFGRRVVQNANHGLDHGHGNVMMLMGAGVKGGHYGSWTPLTNKLDSDLAVTTDYRDVLAEVVSQRLRASSGTVFPGHQARPVGAVSSL